MLRKRILPVRGILARDIVIRELPNGTKDEVNASGELIKRVSDEKTINSTLNWTLATTLTNIYVFAVNGWATTNNAKQATENSGIGKSSDGDYPVTVSATVDARGISIGGSSSNNYLYVRVEKTKVDAMTGTATLDKFKAYLNQYPITLNYQLAKEQIIPITPKQAKRILLRK